ncbi:glycosyl hydrolase [Verticillium alfalfae VaMs.102]|uniref:Glycosyl hydrolase n=1 Tax=Verticillium alfalfae (strain VaMs.102 / ATCC MYA-4576 / FGSC 10136) TaxID=526221 RepID=C9SA23_VERA1|nr:glycosyl hydrolase [Verticillium alfalfae VaMs.102]EEY16236.1 glycosyl hydrolase [Verticillium alfalfae VaMs.102]
MLHLKIKNEAWDFWWIDWQQVEHPTTPSIDPCGS